MFGILEDVPFIGDLFGKQVDNMHAEEMQSDQQNFNEDQASKAQTFNRDEAVKQRDFNSAQAVAQRDWAERLSNTQYQRATADMKASGLNPMLAYHQGGAGVPSGMSASGGAATATPGSSGIATGGRGRIDTTMQSASQIKLNDAIEDRTRAEAETQRSVKAEIDARTPTHAVSIDKMRQEIKESIERIDKIRQETIHTMYSAQNVEQHTQNLRALLPQIAATVKNLEAMTKQTGAMTGKTLAETQELQQKIKQNLPELNAKLMRIEELAKQTDMPRRMQDERLHDSAVGSLAAILRALVPFMK